MEQKQSQQHATYKQTLTMASCNLALLPPHKLVICIQVYT